MANSMCLKALLITVDGDLEVPARSLHQTRSHIAKVN